MSVPRESGVLDTLRVLKKRKRLLAACWLIGLLAAGLRAQLAPKRYSAEVVLKFTPRTTANKPAETIATETVSFEMSELVRRVSERTSLPPGSILAAVSVRQIRASNLISVRARWSDARTALSLANAMADEALRWRAERETRQTQDDLFALRARLEASEAAVRRLEEEKRSYLEKHPSTGRGDQLATQLLELDSTRRGLLSRFTESHPDVVRVEMRIAQLRDLLAQLPAQEMGYERLERRLQSAAEESQRLRREESLARAELDSRRLHSDLAVYSRPELPSRPSEPDLWRDLFLASVFSLVLGGALALLLEDSDQTLSRIEQTEEFIGLPVLGVTPHFSGDRPGCLFSEAGRRRKEPARSEILPPCRQECSPCFVEHFHAARAGIETRLNRAGTKTVLFTSSQMGEGKTLSSIGFALAAAQSGLRTLLIDADLRRPSIHRALGVAHEAGLCDVLCGKRAWEDSVLTLADMVLGQLDVDRFTSFPGIENLHLMTCVADRAHIIELLSLPALARTLSEMRSRYDYILLDSPPVLMFCDALLLSEYADGVVLVYRSGATPRATLGRAKQCLTEARRNLFGVLLNDQAPTDSEEEYGPYRQGYGQYKADTPVAAGDRAA